jgi:hypothetical protein
VVLDILKRAVLLEFLQEGFDLLLAGGHFRAQDSTAAADPRSRKVGETWAPPLSELVRGWALFAHSHVSQKRRDMGHPACTE